MKTILASLSCCITVAILVGVSEASTIDDPEPFRMRKVNLVWLKAKRLSFSKERLNKLFVELQRQDKDERKLKQKKADGEDKDGEMEAVIRRNLARIMEKHGLSGKDEEQSPNSSDKPLHDVESNRVKNSADIKDDRLEKIWQSALEGGVLIIFQYFTPIFIKTMPQGHISNLISHNVKLSNQRARLVPCDQSV